MKKLIILLTIAVLICLAVPAMAGGDGIAFDESVSVIREGGTLILNGQNDLVQYVTEHLEDADPKDVDMFIEQLYDLARIANQPLRPEEMTEFIARSNRILGMLG